VAEFADPPSENGGTGIRQKDLKGLRPKAAGLDHHLCKKSSSKRKNGYWLFDQRGDLAPGALKMSYTETTLPTSAWRPSKRCSPETRSVL